MFFGAITRSAFLGLALAALTALPDVGRAACLSARETRAAVSAGEASSLASALRQAGIDGQAVNAQLCGSPGSYVWRVQVLQPDGRLRQVEVPAG